MTHLKGGFMKKFLYGLLIVLLFAGLTQAGEVVYSGAINVFPNGTVYTTVTSTATQTLPAATTGLPGRIYSTEANIVALTVAPAATEKIQFGRVLGGAGKTLVGDGLAYSTLYCECVTAGQWNCYDNSGVFTLTP